MKLTYFGSKASNYRYFLKILLFIINIFCIDLANKVVLTNFTYFLRILGYYPVNIPSNIINVLYTKVLGFYKIHLKASQSKWVNFNYVWYGVNSLKFGGVHLSSHTFKCLEVYITNDENYLIWLSYVTFPPYTDKCNQ